MVVDTSALIAIAFKEEERTAFADLMTRTTPVLISAVNFYEASLVVATKKHSRHAAELVDTFIREFDIHVAPVDGATALAARASYFRYGRGWHAAKLNFADCFAYALAKTRNEPLLFKGDDFAQTDIVPAWRL
jgi:ribonuclease VapC